MPGIFLCLILANAVYFGWKFMEGTQPQARPLAAQSAQLGARLALLNERPDMLPSAESIKSAEPQGQEQLTMPVSAMALQCFNVGPFPAANAWKQFAGPMRDKHFSVRVDQRKVSGKDYWVFVPAFTDHEKANDRLRDIKARGIDGFVVNQGVFVNAISLNHFSRKDLAEAYLIKMQAAGVAVEYREIALQVSEQWLYLSPGQSKLSLRSAIDAQIGKSEGLKRESAPCEE